MNDENFDKIVIEKIKKNVDMPEKIKRITGLYNVKEKEAVKMMADTDKRRRTNYNFYTDQNWGKASNYTLCLNSSQLG